MKCPVCGHESDGKFCENCGSPLTQNNTQENATNSGYSNPNQNGQATVSSLRTKMVVTTAVSSLQMYRTVRRITAVNSHNHYEHCRRNNRSFDCYYLRCGMQHYSEICRNYR